MWHLLATKKKEGNLNTFSAPWKDENANKLVWPSLVVYGNSAIHPESTRRHERAWPCVVFLLICEWDWWLPSHLFEYSVLNMEANDLPAIFRRGKEEDQYPATSKPSQKIQEGPFYRVGSPLCITTGVR